MEGVKPEPKGARRFCDDPPSLQPLHGSVGACTDPGPGGSGRVTDDRAVEEGTFAVTLKVWRVRLPGTVVEYRICYSWSGRSLSKGFSGGRGQVPRRGVQTLFWGAVEDRGQSVGREEA